MSDKIKNFIKGIVVITVLALALSMTSSILMLKSEDGYDQMKSFYKQKDNTIDALFIGSSKIYCQIDTGVLWDDYGVAAFDLAGAEALPWNSYFYMKEALKTQNPKIIIFDASMMGFREFQTSQPPVWAMTNNYGMRWNRNRIEQLYVNTYDFSEFKKLLFPLNTMHSRYKELTKNDFIDVNNDISYKGFDYRDTIVPFDVPTACNITDEMEVNAKHMEYLMKMNDLAIENNIPFVVMISPYVLSDTEQMYFNYISRICKEKDIRFIDFNQMYDELNLDFQTDMAENIHLNFAGTKKFSDYLGKMMKDEYDVPDRHGEKGYESWEKDALINRLQRTKFEYNHTVDENRRKEIRNSNDYIVFRVSDDGTLNVTTGETLIFNSSEDEYKGFIDEGDIKILFEKKNGKALLNINEQEYSLNVENNILYDRVLKEIINEQYLNQEVEF